MEQLNIHEAKTHLSRLVERAAAGEEIVIARAGRPVAKLVPVGPRGGRRRGGFLKGRLWLAPDWDSPGVNRQLEELFYGGDDEAE